MVCDCSEPEAPSSFCLFRGDDNDDDDDKANAAMNCDEKLNFETLIVGDRPKMFEKSACACS